jgi:hypothetical protein
LYVWGEALITANTNYASDHYHTGISLANCFTALGLTIGNYTYKGDAYTHLEIFTAAGGKYAYGNAAYGYGLRNENYESTGILNCARYYQTDGATGGWASNNIGPYAVTNTWLFSFVMEDA